MMDRQTQRTLRTIARRIEEDGVKAAYLNSDVDTQVEILEAWLADSIKKDQQFQNLYSTNLGFKRDFQKLVMRIL